MADKKPFEDDDMVGDEVLPKIPDALPDVLDVDLDDDLLPLTDDLDVDLDALVAEEDADEPVESDY